MAPLAPPTFPPAPRPRVSAGAARAGKRARLQQKDWAPYAFLSPFLLLFGCFGLFPVLFSLYVSFQRWDPTTGLGAMRFVRLENYAFTLGDPWFWKSLRNTLWIAVGSGVPQHAVALPLAYFLHVAYRRWRNTVTGAYFLPFVTSSVAVSLAFFSLFSKDFGAVNAMLDWAAKLPGVGPLLPRQHVDWLGQAAYTRPAVSLVVFWRYLGWNTVLYLSALQAISPDLVEAARMDGAARWQTFRHVVVPLLRPMMLFAVTLSVIGGLQLFEEPFILLGPTGGVRQSGLTSAMYLYRTAFEFGDFGTAAALAWILFATIALLTWANHRLFARLGRAAGGGA